MVHGLYAVLDAHHRKVDPSHGRNAGRSDGSYVTAWTTFEQDIDQKILPPSIAASQETVSATSLANFLIATTDNDLFVFANGSGDIAVSNFAAGENTDDVTDISAFNFATFTDVYNAATDIG